MSTNIETLPEDIQEILRDANNIGENLYKELKTFALFSPKAAEYALEVVAFLDKLKKVGANTYKPRM